MLSYAQALETIVHYYRCRPLATETLPVVAAAGRVLATALVAPYDMPPFAQSMMDGYALRSRDTRAASPTQPLALALGPTLTAGDSPSQALAAGQTCRIMTGAPLPPGADTVMRLEDSEVVADTLMLRQPYASGRHVQARGAEIRRRTVVLPAGERLTPQRIGTALALGLHRVEVVRQPHIALIAPGNELLPPGAPWQAGKKWCSNLYALDLRVEELGGRSRNLGIVPDRLDSLKAQLQGSLDADGVVILGGSGRGDHDFAQQAMSALGATTLFRGVAISPGRSTAVAHCQQTLIFGLPGSPWAAFVGFEIFIRPALRAMLGQQPPLGSVQQATLGAPLQVRPGMTHFQPASLQSHAQGYLATPLDNLLTLARADAQPLGLIMIPPYRRRLPIGARVRVYPLTS